MRAEMADQHALIRRPRTCRSIAQRNNRRPVDLVAPVIGDGRLAAAIFIACELGGVLWHFYGDQPISFRRGWVCRWRRLQGGWCMRMALIYCWLISWSIDNDLVPYRYFVDESTAFYH